MPKLVTKQVDARNVSLSNHPKKGARKKRRPAYHVRQHIRTSHDELWTRTNTTHDAGCIWVVLMSSLRGAIVLCPGGCECASLAHDVFMPVDGDTSFFAWGFVV